MENNENSAQTIFFNFSFKCNLPDIGHLQQKKNKKIDTIINFAASNVSLEKREKIQYNFIWDFTAF